MTNASAASVFEPARLGRLADGLMVAVAVSLPWSTSASGILLVLWLIALVPTLNWPDVRRELLTAAGGLPVLLFALGALGMLWADVSWIERWKGLDSFFKLLVIPLLFVQFRRSGRGLWVFAGYGLSCFALLGLSSVFALWPGTAFLFTHDASVPVKNAATQSGEFITCIFALLYLAHEFFERRQWPWMLGLAAVMLGMLANIFYVATARTALAVLPVLLVLFAVRKLSGGGRYILLAVAIAIAAGGFLSSQYLRDRVFAIWSDMQRYEISGEQNSSGERVEFARKSIAFIREAPVIGHGTGSIHALFTKSAVGKAGAAASATTNPHNQTFAVAIQLGLIGAGVLWAMWIVHLILFRGQGLTEWIGLVVVAQNMIGSLFNSHVFDFTQGWVYVLGVGVAGGVAVKRRAMEKIGGAP